MALPLVTDASGRFVSRDRAALWADTCAWCGLRSSSHLRAFGMTCPDDKGHPVYDGLRFEPSLPSGCLDARRHEPGCDCSYGVCR